MPTLRFTDAAIQKLRLPPSGRVEYWDAHVGSSVGLQISATGIKSWIVRPRVLVSGQWKTAKITVGRYPAMSLKDARKKADEIVEAARSGQDSRRLQEHERKAVEYASRKTFGHLVQEFLTRYVERKNLKRTTVREYRRALIIEAAPWNDRLVTEITKADIRDALDTMTARGCSVGVNRQLAYLRRFFGWCAEQDLIEIVPTDRLKPPSTNTKRERFLRRAEIPEVWAAFEDRGWPFGDIFKLLLLTGQRRDEVSGMRWSELKGLDGSEAAVWELPSERTKNKRAHLVPLAPQAVRILRGVPRIEGSPFVFTTTGKTPVSGYSNAKDQVDNVIAQDRENVGIAEPMPEWRLHDLRRTVSTLMHEDLGILPHVVEAVLNHVSGARAGVAGVYNRALYLEDKRRALEAWADHVEGLIAAAANEPAVAMA